MTRFLHVIRSADPGGGGPIELVKQLGSEHAAQGGVVELVTLDSPEAPWLRAMPFPVHALGPVRTNYGYTTRLLPWVRENAPRFDIVIVNGLWQYPGLCVWRALRGTSTRYLVFPHGMLDPWFKRRYPLKHLKKWLYWPWAEYRVLRDAAAVLFTSEDERLRARKSFRLYRCREEVITCGTAPPPPASSGERERFLAKFPAVAGTRAILFLGRLHEKKGCELLIHAFARLCASGDDSSRSWHLVLAGAPSSDAYLAHLRRLVDVLGLTDRVTWTGMLSGELKWAALRMADVFVLPSHQENFGMAVAEALGCGTPVLVSTQVNIWREIVADGAGLAEPDDQAGTTRLLSRWAALDFAEREAMRGHARACFAARFNVRRAAARLAQLVDAPHGRA